MSLPEQLSPFRRWIEILAPRLAGATRRDQLAAGLGALFAIGLTGVLSGYLTGHHDALPLLVAPMGATAVLLFAVPASPLAQPWPVVGGNMVSAAIGVLVVHLLPPGALACAVAVACAIVAMAMLRCLHPPGGAAALTTALLALNGQIPGPLFVLIPVGLNALLMVLLAWLFHHLSHHAYPHVPAPAPEPEKARLFTDADLDAVLADEHEAFDIERADLERLIARVEEAARRRRASGRPAGKR